MELIPFFFLFVFLFFIFNDQYSIWQDFRTGPYFIMHTAFVKKAQLKQEAQWFISFQETCLSVVLCTTRKPRIIFRTIFSCRI